MSYQHTLNWLRKSNIALAHGWTLIFSPACIASKYSLNSSSTISQIHLSPFYCIFLLDMGKSRGLFWEKEMQKVSSWSFAVATLEQLNNSMQKQVLLIWTKSDMDKTGMKTETNCWFSIFNYIHNSSKMFHTVITCSRIAVQYLLWIAILEPSFHLLRNLCFNYHSIRKTRP